LQLCQILTDFNIFAVPSPEICTKKARIYLFILRGRRPAARASDLRVVRTGPVCCEPCHRRVEVSSVGLCRRCEKALYTYSSFPFLSFYPIL